MNPVQHLGAGEGVAVRRCIARLAQERGQNLGVEFVHVDRVGERVFDEPVVRLHRGRAVGVLCRITQCAIPYTAHQARQIEFHDEPVP